MQNLKFDLKKKNQKCYNILIFWEKQFHLHPMPKHIRPIVFFLIIRGLMFLFKFIRGIKCSRFKNGISL